MRARLNTLNEGIRIALEAIRATKIRAGLTISGVAIGVGVVVTMAAMITRITRSACPIFFFIVESLVEQLLNQKNKAGYQGDAHRLEKIIIDPHH